jgi:hypothetical protein
MDAEILALASAADGLAVTVGRTPIGTFRVVFRDTDAGAVIETRVFTDRERAIGFARGLIAQGPAVQTLILRTVDGDDTLSIDRAPLRRCARPAGHTGHGSRGAHRMVRVDP